MRSDVKLITPSTVELIDIETVLSHLREDGDVERIGNLVRGYLNSAITEFENLTGCALGESTWEFYPQRWPCIGYAPIKLPLGRVTAVQSIVYTTLQGEQKTFDPQNYQFTNSMCFPGFTSAWPTEALSHVQPIVITLTAGYASADELPADVKSALLFRVQTQYTPQHNAAESAQLQRQWDAVIERYRNIQ